MTRVRLLRSAEQDLDAIAHVRAIRSAADVVREDRPVLSEWSLIARSAARLWSGRDEADVLITVGDAALVAASLAPRWPTIHVPVGAPTPRECSLLTTRLRRARVIVATRTARLALLRAGVESSRVEVVRGAIHPATTSRDDARKTLGLDASTTVVHVPGSVRPDSGHRLSLYACAILSYAEPAWQHLVSARGDVGHAERFLASVVPGGPVRVARDVDDAAVAAAADVAVFASSGAPERAAIEMALSSSSAIVAPASLWRRELLPTDERIHLFEGRKARTVARTVLDAGEARLTGRLLVANRDDDRGDWSMILRAPSFAL